MKKILQYNRLTGFIACLALTGCIAFLACNKTKYSFGKIVTPSGLAISTVIRGADATHPTGDGSGNVTITVSASSALQYKFYFGNGDSLETSSGTVNYKYTKIDTNNYTISVNAIGTGGATSTITEQVRVLYVYVIPAPIMAGLTNGSSKKWKSAADTAGNFGVGASNGFTPGYYMAQPNEKPTCAYDDEITFTRVDSNTITMSVDNKGESFLIGASVAFYGQAGSQDGCYAISTGGTKTLAFGAATSGSDASNSTGVMFTVPGNGIIDFGTGGNSYEILFLSSGVVQLRNIGIDTNAWYQILRAE